MTRDPIQAAAGHPFIVHATKIATSAMLAALLSGCSLISFEVERDIPEQRVRGNLVSMLLDGVLENPIPMDIDLEQETAAQDTGPACAAHLTALSFTITDTGVGAADDDNFDFIDAVTLHVESAKEGSDLPRLVLASLDPVPRGLTTLELTPTDVDLLPYIEERAVITSSASGTPPSDDVTFVGVYAVEIEAL